MRASLVAIAFLAACESADPGVNDSGSKDSGSNDSGSNDSGSNDSGSNDSGSNDSGSNDSGSDAGPDPTPILERTPAGAVTCTISRGMLAADLAGEYGVRPAMAVTPSGTFFNAKTTVEPSIVIAPVDTNGTVGAPAVRIATTTDDIHRPSLIADADGFALAWIQQNRIYFARYDANGVETVAPRMVGGAPTYDFIELELARSDAGFGVAAIEVGYAPTVRSALHFIGLDASGQAAGEQTLVAIAPDIQLFAPRIAGAGADFAIAYQRTESMSSEIHFARVALDGTVAADQRIDSADGPAYFGFSTPSLGLERFDGDWVVAWVESFYSEEDLHSTILLARVDADGNTVVPPTLVRRAEQDIEEVEPRLIRFNGMLGLIWSRGGGSRTCGICTAGHSFQLVLLDADTWIPASNVIDQPSTIIGERGQNGGVLSQAPVTFGDDILAAFLIRYHTESVPASALVHCGQ